MNRICLVFLAAFMLFGISLLKAQQQQPNVLWVLTDDQRYDAISAFNRMLHDRDSSELGYVESPNVDRLAGMGTTFINTYCQAAGCAPSRASMHLGRYPFRSGIYEFEYHNNMAEHYEPTLPEQMAALGYQTVHIGKLGVRLKTKQGQRMVKHPIYQTDFDFKALHRDGLTDWGKDWFRTLDGEKFEQPIKNMEYFVSPDGTVEYMSEELERLRPAYAGSTEKALAKYDILRHFNKKKGKSIYKGMILSGVSPQPAGKTRDGYYSAIFRDFLANEQTTFPVGKNTFEGVDSDRPLFCHIGYDFPHTPVLPPADFRARFREHTYKIPQFDEAEFEAMPAQMRKQVNQGYSDHFTDEQKLAMIQDYFAFCAYGDQLIGQAVDDFIAYSEKHQQEWMIVYVCGDHGWKLNDHGSVSKFSPWDIDTHNPIIVVSSDKAAYPANKVVRAFTEFVDIAPSILAAGGADLSTEKYAYLDGFDLAGIADGSIPPRDYVIGESHAVTGPRAYIRTREYVFSMQTRPNKKRGANLEWALNASYEELDPGLYHMPSDPGEQRNLAFEKKYRKTARTLQKKLTDIVLGDGRVEVQWGKKADGTEVYRSNFAPGAHDHKLKLK